MPRLPEVLRDRNYRLLYAGQSVSLLGDGMITMTLAFAVIGLDGSATEVGIVLGSQTAAVVACLLFGGVVADRLPRRGLMVTADVVRMLSQGTMAALLISDAAEVWTLAVLAAATGAATGFFNPASTGLLPAVVKPEQLQEANGLRGASQAFGEIFGRMLAGILIATVGAGWALAFDAATYAVSGVLLSRLRLPPHIARETTGFLHDLREGWSAFRSRTWVWVYVLSAALGNLMWGAWAVLGPVVAERDLGGAAVWGVVLAGMGIGGLVGSFLTMRLQLSRPMFAAACAAALFTVPMAMLAAGAPAVLLVVATFVSGAALFFANEVWESTLQRHVPGEQLSRVSAYDWFGSLAFYPIGVIAWGALADPLGTQTALWIAYAGSVAIGLAVLAVRDIRRLPAYPA